MKSNKTGGSTSKDYSQEKLNKQTYTNYSQMRTKGTSSLNKKGMTKLVN
jgi:hypothetical protein